MEYNHNINKTIIFRNSIFQKKVNSTWTITAM